MSSGKYDRILSLRYKGSKIETVLYNNQSQKHFVSFSFTVEPLIVDPPNKGHNRINLSIKNTS